MSAQKHCSLKELIIPRIPNQRSKSHLNYFKEPGLTFVIVRAYSWEKEKEGGIFVSTNLGLVLRKASVLYY